MIFAEIATADAVGAYLAHAVRIEGQKFKKGHHLTEVDIETLLGAGVETVIAASLEDGDIHEETAAKQIGHSVLGDGVRADPPFTGRVNLFATQDGLLIPDKNKIDAINRLHPSITIATLNAYEPVEEGRMVGTVKIIPFAAPEAAIKAASKLGAALGVQPYSLKSVALVATQLPSLKASTMDKTRRVLDERLMRTGAKVTTEVRVAHNAEAIRDGLKHAASTNPDLIILFGASATVDEKDVGPSGLQMAGGTLKNFGMPVDPGNLLFLGELNSTPLIGAPGCARSPAENGFDWVLARVLCGIEVLREDIIGLGVGGLLMEITSRPQPREEPYKRADKIAAVILAAGRSSRMGGPNKLLATLDGKPLVRIVADAAHMSKVDDIIIVTGHMADEVSDVLDDLPVTIIHNPDFKDGLSTSLKTGIDAMDEFTDAAVIMLGDMPYLTPDATGVKRKRPLSLQLPTASVVTRYFGHAGFFKTSNPFMVIQARDTSSVNMRPSLQK